MPSSVRPLPSAALTWMLLHQGTRKFSCTCKAANNIAYDSADDAVCEATSVSEATSSVPSLRRSL